MHKEIAIFELFYRKSPFAGEYTVFAGLGEVISFIKFYKFTEEMIDYTRYIVILIDQISASS